MVRRTGRRSGLSLKCPEWVRIGARGAAFAAGRANRSCLGLPERIRSRARGAAFVAGRANRSRFGLPERSRFGARGAAFAAGRATGSHFGLPKRIRARARGAAFVAGRANGSHFGLPERSRFGARGAAVVVGRANRSRFGLPERSRFGARGAAFAAGRATGSHFGLPERIRAGARVAVRLTGCAFRGAGGAARLFTKKICLDVAFFAGRARQRLGGGPGSGTRRPSLLPDRTRGDGAFVPRRPFTGARSGERVGARATRTQLLPSRTSVRPGLRERRLSVARRGSRLARTWLRRILPGEGRIPFEVGNPAVQERHHAPGGNGRTVPLPPRIIVSHDNLPLRASLPRHSRNRPCIGKFDPGPGFTVEFRMEGPRRTARATVRSSRKAGSTLACLPSACGQNRREYVAGAPGRGVQRFASRGNHSNWKDSARPS
ncbi:hypothetical protein KH5H1_24400 [Corallococcus caeni]|nr:hypothetical protein KH5H1_24400 [Corallococcus sp. KH5-1]